MNIQRLQETKSNHQCVLRSFIKRALHSLCEASTASKMNQTVETFRAFNKKRNKALEMMEKYVDSYYLGKSISGNAFRMTIKDTSGSSDSSSSPHSQKRSLHWQIVYGFVETSKSNTNDDRDWFKHYPTVWNNGSVIPALFDNGRAYALSTVDNWNATDIAKKTENNVNYAVVNWNAKATKEIKPIETLEHFVHNRSYIIEWEALYRAIDVSSNAVQLSVMLKRLALFSYENV
jgi:hypothetical protein